MKLSVCMITLNEEANLPRALESVRPIADEILILDSGSTDRTAEIARSYGAQLVVEPWRGYAAQKTRAMELAQHEWVLFLDADEALSDELRIEILHLKEKEEEPLVYGFEILRVSSMFGKEIRFGDWYPDWLVRLVRKDKACFSGGSVHEKLEVEGGVARLSGVLLHWPYRDFAHQREKVKRYAQLWAEDAWSQGKRAGFASGWAHGAWRFLRWVILRRGYRGGWLGVQLGWACACETFFKYQAFRRKGWE